MTPRESRQTGFHFRSALAAGLWAGALVGLAEAAAVILGSPDAREIQVLWYGPLVYAPAGLALALGLAAGGWFLGKLRGWKTAPGRLFAIYFGLALVLLNLPIARFRIRRDLLHEQPLALGQDLGLLAAEAALLLLCLLVLSRAFRRPALERLVRPSRSVPLLGAGLLLCGLYAAVLGPPPVALSPPAAVPEHLADRPNIILVIVDTLRPDYVSAYGHEGNITPNLDLLADWGTRYENLIAQSSWTKPSIATILTGLYPSTHRAIGKPDVLPHGVETLAETMRAAGYRTGGIVTNINLSPLFQFDQGFDDYRYLGPVHYLGAGETSSRLLAYLLIRLIRERFLSGMMYFRHFYQDAGVVNETVFDWLSRQAGGRFFLVIHYMEPHDPYFEHPYNGVGIARVRDPDPDAAMAGRMRELYEGEIAYWDEHFGRLLAFLRERGLYDETLIAVTADHGEEFHEHGGWWHGTTLYEEVVRLPLIVKWPRSGPWPRAPYAPPVEDTEESDTGPNVGRRIEPARAWPRVVAPIVRTIDIAPTILQAAGVPVPAAVQGLSLLTDPAARPKSDGWAFAEENFEGNVLYMTRTPGAKWITANPGNPRGLAERELYDLEADGAETENLADDPDYADVWPELEAGLRRTRDLAESAAVAGAQVEIGSDDLDWLRALGYVEEDDADEPSHCGGS